MDVIRRGPRFNASLGLLALAGAVAVGRAAFAASLTVPVGAPIPVELTQTYTSQSSHVGDPFTFETTKDVVLGTLTVPKGTPGHGRLAVVVPAQGRDPGQLGLQADSVDLPDGDTVWVNIDTSKPPKGHLADKHTKPIFLPLPIGFGGGYQTTSTGNMVLDKGTSFTVLTIAPRAAPAVLLTAAPTPEPTATPTPHGMKPPAMMGSAPPVMMGSPAPGGVMPPPPMPGTPTPVPTTH